MLVLVYSGYAPVDLLFRDQGTRRVGPASSQNADEHSSDGKNGGWDMLVLSFSVCVCLPVSGCCLLGSVSLPYSSTSIVIHHYNQYISTSTYYTTHDQSRIYSESNIFKIILLRFLNPEMVPDFFSAGSK